MDIPHDCALERYGANGFFDDPEDLDFDFMMSSLPLDNPSLDHPPSSPVSRNARGNSSDNNTDHSSAGTRNVAPPTTPAVDLDSEAACLEKALELFPDISHQYVAGLFTIHKSNASRQAQDIRPVDRVIEDILEKSSYPKQKDAKRKRTEEQEDDQEWKDDSGQSSADADYKYTSMNILVHDFPYVPSNYIRQLVFQDKGKLYSAYLTLASYENSSSTKPYQQLKNARKPFHLKLASSADNPLVRELKAAKRKVERDTAIARQEKEQEEAERLNEEEYTRAGALVECHCCYGDVPSNRAIPCEGTDVHFFCFACIRRSAETQIGLMKYQIVCFDTSGCKAGFGRSQLEQATGEAIMRKLESLQQQDEIAKAGLDGLEECPFCEFKAVCPPVEDDREFRCCNPDCDIVSCRLCRTESHIPQTCAEAKKERGVSERHLVEEAMSEALIRPCPRCGVKIVKEFGCNKMTCPQCRCLICYMCKKDITREGYSHFQGYGQGSRTTNCRVNDDPTRDQEEIDQAEKAAIEKIRTENPELEQEALEVQRPEERKRKKQSFPHEHLHNPRIPRRPLPPLPRYNPVLGPPVPPHRQDRQAFAPNLMPFPQIATFAAPPPNLVPPPHRSRFPSENGAGTPWNALPPEPMLRNFRNLGFELADVPRIPDYIRRSEYTAPVNQATQTSNASRNPSTSHRVSAANQRQPYMDPALKDHGFVGDRTGSSKTSRHTDPLHQQNSINNETGQRHRPPTRGLVRNLSRTGPNGRSPPIQQADVVDLT